MQSALETTASHRSGFVKLLGDFLNPRICELCGRTQSRNRESGNQAFAQHTRCECCGRSM